MFFRHENSQNIIIIIVLSHIRQFSNYTVNGILLGNNGEITPKQFIFDLFANMIVHLLLLWLRMFNQSF